MELEDYASDQPVVFVVGAMAHGKVNHEISLVGYIAVHPVTISLSLSLLFSLLVTQVDVDYTEEEVAISEYPLSAALTCTKLCCAFERAWGIK